MITTTSSHKEIAAQYKVDYSLISENIEMYLLRDRISIRRAILKSQTDCMKPLLRRFTSKVSGETYNVVLFGIYIAKSYIEQYLFGAKSGFSARTTSDQSYLIKKDLRDGTNKLVILQGEGEHVVVYIFSTHAVRRYMQRFMEKECAFEEVCEMLVKRNLLFGTLFCNGIYGATSYRRTVYRTGDGVFLGYFDSGKMVHRVETFITDEMLMKDQRYFALNLVYTQRVYSICRNIPKRKLSEDEMQYLYSGTGKIEIMVADPESDTPLHILTKEEEKAVERYYNEVDMETRMQRFEEEVKLQNEENRKRTIRKLSAFKA